MRDKDTHHRSSISSGCAIEREWLPNSAPCRPFQAPGLPVRRYDSERRRERERQRERETDRERQRQRDRDRQRDRERTGTRWRW